MGETGDGGGSLTEYRLRYVELTGNIGNSLFLAFQTKTCNHPQVGASIRCSIGTKSEAWRCPLSVSGFQYLKISADPHSGILG